MELPSASPTGNVSTKPAPAAEPVSRPAPSAPDRAREANPGTPSETGIQPAPPRQPTKQELQQAVADLQRKTQSFAPDLRFSVDKDTGRTIVKVTDANTQEVIRQIPAEEVLKLAKEIDRMQGILFNKQA